MAKNNRKELDSLTDWELVQVYCEEMGGIDESDLMIEVKGNKAERENLITDLLQRGYSKYAKGSTIKKADFRMYDKVKFTNKIGTYEGTIIGMDDKSADVKYHDENGKFFTTHRPLTDLTKTSNYYKKGATIPLPTEESIGSLEKKLQSAEKRYQKAHLQEQIGDISVTELNAFEDKLKKAREKVNNWYKSRYGSQSMKKGSTIESNLEKELRKLQRDLNSSRLSTYREGDNSEEAKALRNERAVKLTRFNEVLKLLRESNSKMAKGSTINGTGFVYTIGGL